VACAVLVGFGIFYFIDPLDYFGNNRTPQSDESSQSDRRRQPDDERQPGDEHQSDEEQEPHEPEVTPTPEPEHTTVQFIDITHMGEIVLELELTTGNEIAVRAIPEPYIAYVDIEWISNNTGIFTVTPFGVTGSEARIEAVSPGSAMLTVTSGDAIRECLIIVLEEDTPPPNDSTLREFYDNVNNTNVGLRLVVSWIDGPQAGRESIYWRDRNSSTWYIRRVSGVVDEINPEFGYNDAVLTILWPVMNYARTHNLFEDGTGFFSRDYGRANSVYENLIWELTIS